MARRPGLVRPLAQLAAAGVLGFVARDRIARQDERARAVIYNKRAEVLDQTLPAVTDLGSTYAIAGATGALWALGRRALARDVLIAGGAAWTIAQAAKPLFKRARPYDAGEVPIMVRKPAGLSYPSGHPAVAAAIARVLEPDLRQPARTLVERIPRIVAFSRVYVGVHYPTDVIGGLWIGRAVGDLVLRYARRR